MIRHYASIPIGETKDSRVGVHHSAKLGKASVILFLIWSRKSFTDGPRNLIAFPVGFPVLLCRDDGDDAV